MDRETRILVDYFPSLANDPNFKITSPWTYDYNCIAWALGIDGKRLWPYVEDEDGNIIPPDEYEDGDDDIYWPNNVARDKKLETFVHCFQSFGYTRCHDSSLESGFTKIAIYTLDKEVTHAARQLDNGLWTSKLGPLNDIQHSTPESIEGNFYGKVAVYMKRPL
ncbi:MAG: hypothetical protein J6Y24_11860 [Bacteroidales bacterium]|nr:hypothetical protein [Bacteroidales bacterium]